MVLTVEARVRIVFAEAQQEIQSSEGCARGEAGDRLANCFRVRAAIAALKGYDPRLENWDQSPFHHNETGSNNTKTLAVAGVEVPLVELHTATRMR